MFCAAATAAPVPGAAVSTLPDGAVVAGGVVYPSRSAFYTSDYFQQNGLRCGTRPPDNLYGDPQAPLASATDCTLGQTVIQGDYYLPKAYVIPVVFHIITAANGTTGYLSDQQIMDQLEVLNQDFRALPGTMGSLGNDTMIQFELAGITRTANDNWYADNDESGYKNTLGWDRQIYLNIYTNTASGYLGYSYLPQEYAGEWRDGVVLNQETVGGRDQSGEAPFEQGRTAVHEVGHYLGLDHTFAGGCTNTYTTGDLIVDTNAEETDHYGCTQTSTCSSPDPIHNYMNYTDDSCMQEFTSEQANRMVCSLVNYRPELYHLRILTGPMLPLLPAP
jgi:hypothetical protein